MKPISVKKVRSNAILPVYGSQGAAGADLFACLDDPLVINPGKSAFVPTGLSMEIPEGFAGLIYARSGLACKRGLAPANKVGVIDSDYRGEIMVSLHNHSDEEQSIEKSERIAQIVFTPYVSAKFETVDELTDTVRGEGGFGSTGKK